MSEATSETAFEAVGGQRSGNARAWIARRAEGVVLPLAALFAGMAAFSIFLLVIGKSPPELFELMWRGGFSSWFSIQNTLSRTTPLAIAGMAVGALWIGGVGALRHYRAVNETISSLLLAYIAIAIMNHLVEGPLRDPASLNKPSTQPLEAAYRIGSIPGTDVHWGLAVGVVACILCWVLIEKTSWGFAARIAGGNIRAAQIQGLPVGSLIVGFCAIAGACAGLGGMLEVTAVDGAANASLAAGYGYTGILVAFLARQNPLAIIPVAILLGGIDASGGLIQRRMHLPDATVLVLQGMIFIAILFSDTFYGRFKAFNPELWTEKA